MPSTRSPTSSRPQRRQSRARKPKLSGRHPSQPEVLFLDTHPLVKDEEPHGQIIVVVGHQEPARAEELLKYASLAPTPRNREEIHKAGFVVIDSNEHPIVFWRHRGCRDPTKDRKRIWCISRDDYEKDPKGQEALQEMMEVQEEVLGDDKDMAKGKPTIDPLTKEYVGGIAYERSSRAVNLKNGPRSLPLATSIQVPKGLDSPSSGRKYYGEDDPHTETTQKLLRVGARAGMMGLELAPEGFKEELEKQAEVLNLPRIGVHENIGFHNMQLNIADAQDPLTETHLRESLGRAGDSHLDGSDSAGGFTAMTNLTRPHPDVEAEYFFIFELGIAIRLHPLATVMFSGLYYHCGHQAYYRKHRTDNRLYVRLTLIAYPPSGLLHGTTSSALGMAGKDAIKVPMEAKIWSKLFEWERPGLPTSQATYAVDGSCIMQPRDHANHIIRSIVQLVLFLVMQARPDLLIRFDAQALLSAFTFVDGKVRVHPEPWKFVPGWEGDDVAVGQEYTVAPSALPLEEVQKLRNSDTESEYPFNRKDLDGIFSTWDSHCAEQVPCIPLCVVAQERDGVTGGRDTTRKRINREICRKDDDSDEDEEEDVATTGKKKRKKRKKTSKNESANLEPKSKQTGSPAELFDDTPATDSSSSSDFFSGVESGRPAKRPRLTGQNSDSTSMSPPAPNYPSAVQDNAGPKTRSRKKKEDMLYGAGDRPSDRLTTASFSNGLLLYLGQEYLSSYQRSLLDTVNMLDSYDDGLSAPANLLGDVAMLCMENRVHDAWALQEQTVTWMEGVHMQLQHHRASIMLANMLLWEWLAWSLEDGYRYFEQRAPHWLAAAFKDAYQSMLQPHTQYVMDATALIHGYRGATAKHILQPHRRMCHDPFTKDAYIHIVRSALITWFEFRRPEQGQLQALFIRELVGNVGVAAMILPPVWDAYTSLGGSVLLSSLFRTCRPRKDEIEGWLSAMRSLPVCKQASTEAQTLKAIYQLSCNTVGTSFDLEVINAYHEEPLFLPSESPPPSPVPIVPPLTPFAPPLPAPSSALPPLPSGVKKDEFDKLIGEITLLFPFLPPHGQDPSSWAPPTWTTIASPSSPEDFHNNFLADVQGDDDRLLPFRDLALSRRRILHPEGPYSPPHLRTSEGLFSALVYRGITHNSPYLRGPTQPMIMFPTLEAWQTLKDVQPVRVLCNQQAYGQQNIKERAVENANGYWTSSQNSELTSWLLGPGASQKTFSAVYAELKQSKRSSSQGNNSSKDMTTGMGPLILYLLAADYAIAGACQMPTMSEMGAVIWTIGKGGKRGLELLGFDCSTQAAVTASFETLDSLIRTHIAANRLDAMGYNVFVLEHMLCKHKRLRERPSFLKAYIALHR